MYIKKIASIFFALSIIYTSPVYANEEKSEQPQVLAYAAILKHSFENAGNQIKVKWSTTLETNSAGFIIYGQKGEDSWVKLTDIIPSEDQGQGATYEVSFDKDVTAVMIVNIEKNGALNKYGPLKVGIGQDSQGALDVKKKSRTTPTLKIKLGEVKYLALN